jgi:Ca2+-binding EF-hand superfamily protein
MNRTKLSITIASAFFAAFLGASPLAFADTSPEDAARFVTVCDANKDGMVSKAELMARAKVGFEKMDTAKKGMVDSKQFMQFLLDLQKGDGLPSYMASKEQMMKKIEAAFDKVDSGKKGMLDMKQLQAFLTELMKSGA